MSRLNREPFTKQEALMIRSVLAKYTIRLSDSTVVYQKWDVIYDKLDTILRQDELNDTTTKRVY